MLWAATPADVNRLVLDIAARHAVRKIIKSKSMVSEESALDHAIEAAGLTVVETDLGEYILQINDYEPPSHIIGPALHKSKDEVAELFHQKHGTPKKDDIQALCLEARSVLREHYLTADMGISGGNFFVAETGSVVLVTNEGNATLTTTLPKVHVAISGIEKIVPTLEDVATLMRLLPRSATGQSISNYVDILTGAKGNGEFHGAEHMYFILVDAGRTSVLASDVREALRCIRCGACMNHCPVYQNIGGHSYGWVYPGPIGSILTPMYVGLENAHGTAAGVDAVQPVRRRMPGEDPAAGPATQAAREGVRARPAAVARARRPEALGLVRAAPAAVRRRVRHRRAHAAIACAQGRHDRAAAARRRLDDRSATCRRPRAARSANFIGRANARRLPHERTRIPPDLPCRAFRAVATRLAPRTRSSCSPK